MTQCIHPDCPTATTAKGLCAKHYMRLRRHGDAGTVHEGLAWLSPRSRARLIRASRLLVTYGLDREPIIERATRGDGSLNMNAYLEMAEVAVAFYRVEREGEAVYGAEGQGRLGLALEAPS